MSSSDISIVKVSIDFVRTVFFQLNKKLIEFMVMNVLHGHSLSFVCQLKVKAWCTNKNTGPFGLDGLINHQFIVLFLVVYVWIVVIY